MMRLPAPTVLPDELPAAAYDWAHLVLVDALASAIHALQQPACARLIGPVVPGATMVFGARVPGTSYQLDPVQAAFCTGTLMSWPAERDAAFVAPWGHAADLLGTVLTLGDFHARKALAEASTSPTVRGLLRALLEAHARQGQAAAANGNAGHGPAAARAAAVRITAAELTAAALGGSTQHVELAARLAHDEVPGATAAWPWSVGQANSDGTRLGLLALVHPAEEALSVAAGPSVGTADPSLRASLVQSCAAAWATVVNEPELAGRVRDRLGSTLALHYPAVQANRIVAALADRTKLESLPINELVSLTVRN